MSLDDRVRAGLRDAAQSIDPEVGERLLETRTRFRHRRTLRRAALAGALAVGGLVALVLGPQLLDRVRGQSEVLPGTTTLTDAQAEAMLQGMWVTPVVTPAEVTDVLAQAGLGAFSDAVVTDQAYPTAWTLVLGEHSYVIASSTQVLEDSGSWVVEGATLTLVPASCDCVVDFHWSGDADTLTLELVRDQGLALHGVPDEAYARALYTTVPFTRS